MYAGSFHRLYFLSWGLECRRYQRWVWCDGETHSSIIMTNGSLNEGVTLTNGGLCCWSVSLWLSLTAPPHPPLSLTTSCDEGRWPVTAASCLLMCACVGSRWWQGGEFVNGFSVCSAALSHLRSCAVCGSVTIGANECAWQNCWAGQPKYRWHSLLRTLPRWPACWTRRKRSEKLLQAAQEEFSMLYLHQQCCRWCVRLQIFEL